MPWIRLIAIVSLLGPLGVGASGSDRPDDRTGSKPVASDIGSAPSEAQIEAGLRLYEIYCRSCHGDGGRGDGPTAAEMRPTPADLTQIRERNRGEFPVDAVRDTIDGRARLAAHDTTNRMPVWGLGLQELDSDAGQEREVEIKLGQLIDYLRSIQVGD